MGDIAGHAEREILRRRDDLVERRTRLLQQRAALIAELRLIDHDLEDCKATARFFGLEITFPPGEREEYERIRAEQRAAEMRAREITNFAAQKEVKRQEEMFLSEPSRTVIRISGAQDKPDVLPIAKSNKPTKSVRELVLEQLKMVDAKGMKAAQLRDFLERTHGLVLHDKTVGMTLYRLSKDKKVHRKGQTWIVGAQGASEAKDPGAEAPRQVSS